MKTEPGRPRKGGTILRTSITLEQVSYLEEKAAQRKESGWVIPEWLIELRYWVNMRDSGHLQDR